MSSTAGLPDSRLKVSANIVNGLSSSPLAELVKLVQRNAAVTAFKLTQISATRVAEVALRDISLASKRLEYGGERRLK
jgi:hypothetical protein